MDSEAFYCNVLPLYCADIPIPMTLISFCIVLQTKNIMFRKGLAATPRKEQGKRGMGERRTIAAESMAGHFSYVSRKWLDFFVYIFLQCCLT